MIYYVLLIFIILIIIFFVFDYKNKSYMKNKLFITRDELIEPYITDGYNNDEAIMMIYFYDMFVCKKMRLPFSSSSSMDKDIAKQILPPQYRLVERNYNTIFIENKESNTLYVVFDSEKRKDNVCMIGKALFTPMSYLYKVPDTDIINKYSQSPDKDKFKVLNCEYDMYVDRHRDYVLSFVSGRQYDRIVIMGYSRGSSKALLYGYELGLLGHNVTTYTIGGLKIMNSFMKKDVEKHSKVYRINNCKDVIVYLPHPEKGCHDCDGNNFVHVGNNIQVDYFYTNIMFNHNILICGKHMKNNQFNLK